MATSATEVGRNLGNAHSATNRCHVWAGRGELWEKHRLVLAIIGHAELAIEAGPYTDVAGAEDEGDATRA